MVAKEAISSQKKSTFLINVISVVFPVLIAILLAFPNKLDLGSWTKILPHIIGSINTLTALTLISGLIYIKLGNQKMHRFAMISAFSMGFVFLFCYVTYHVSNPSNKFSGDGLAKGFYLIVLLTHILFSLVVLPLVLRAMYFALTQQFERHKRIVRFAYPIWLYVSITGVIVYLMLYQLFPSR